MFNKKFGNWSYFDIGWFIMCNISILILTLFTGDISPISVIMAITGISANILVAKGSLWNYPLGIINVLIYAFIAYNATLYGDFTLNLFYYFPMNIIGWVIWYFSAKNQVIRFDSLNGMIMNKRIFVINNKPTHKQGQIEFKSLSTMGFVKVALSTMVLIFAYGLVLQAQGDMQPFIDSTSTILSIVSMILMIKCYKEQWTGWIIVNIVTIIMWYRSYITGMGDMITLAMWVVYLLNSIYGWIVWYIEAKKNK